MSSPRQDYCPTCGVAYEPLQEYCLECGSRLPTNRGVVGFLASGWQRRLAWYPGDWVWPVLLLLVVAAVAAAASVAAGSPREQPALAIATSPEVSVGPGAPRGTVPTATAQSTLPAAPAPTITTGALPAAPGAPSTVTATTPTPRKKRDNALAVWPAGTTGFTIVLESIPLASGHAAAVAKARAAKKAGLPQVGVLLSSQYSSLHPGYFVIFSGIYGTATQAQAALPLARTTGFPDAYQTGLTR